MTRHSISTIYILGALIGLFTMMPDAAAAQVDTVFSVTVEDKSIAHAEEGDGWPEGYSIDGQQSKPVTVVRGQTYVFQLDDVPAIHPFYISTSEVGQGADPYSDGVEGNFATGDETVTFTPTESTPDLLYYQCGSHEFMGWRIYVRDQAEIGLQSVAEGLISPVGLAQPDDGTDRLFIIDQAGQIRLVTSDGALVDEPFLDVSGRMVTLQAGFDERGLLGLAFHPNYQTNGRFFVYYSAPLRDSAPGNWNSTSTISEFQVSDGDPNTADPNSERILLQVDQPQGNHNAGTLSFGPDGFLYISLGDGGGANDVGTGHVSDWYDANEGGNAQNVEANLLGTLLRIDVDGADPYGIPLQNPFVDRGGLDEIFAYGLRNPYRFSFDAGGELGLLVGDAGQDRYEEVNQVEVGGNYGWNVWEGTHCFDAANPESNPTNCPTEVGAGHPDAGQPLQLPVIEYLNANQEGGLGFVVVGGVVYRGESLPAFDGHYVFGDWSSSPERANGLVFIAEPVDEGRWPFHAARIVNRPNDELGHYLLGIGQDLAGEAYVLTTDTVGPTGTSGKVYRIVHPSDVTASGPDAELPQRMALEQNYPNPFNPTTTIRFNVPHSGHVTLTIYDVLGREVATLVDGVVTAGDHSVVWNAREDAGSSVASGSYVYRLRGAGTTLSRVLTVVK